MGKRVLLIATVQSHIGQFHKPLMKLLKEHGWEIHVAARNNLAEKNGLQLEYPDKVFNIPFQRSPFDMRNIGAYKELKRILKENHYDVIHCNTPVGGILGRFAGRRYRRHGTQVFYTAHGFHFYKGAPKMNWLIYYPIEKFMSRFTDKLITITKEDYDRASKRFHCKTYRIHGVGVDENRFFPVTEEEKQRLKMEMGFLGPVTLNVGELLPNKNQKTAIMAMKNVAERYPSAVLLIAGNGPEKNNLEQAIRDAGLEQNIQLLGYCTHLQDYQHIADVLIACSYREGLPLNVVEAMLSGTPVVASRNRGHHELIEEGKTGFLVGADDTQAFADKIFEILSNPGLFRGAMLTAAKPYTKQSVQKELASIYEL